MLSERLNYSALHSIRHVGSVGSGLFGAQHFLGGYNRSILPTNTLQHIPTANMIFYNSANQIRPFSIPTSSSSSLHPLPTNLGVLAAAAAGSSGINDAAVIAMQAAAQAVNYQNSFKSAAHLVTEMKAARIQNLATSTPSPTILASLSQQQNNLDRHPFLPALHSALSSPKLSSLASRNSPPLTLSSPSLNVHDEPIDRKI